MARLIDLVPVAVLFGALWVAGSQILESQPGACDPAPAPGCNVVTQADHLDQAGNTVIEFTLADARVIDSEHPTFQIGGRVYIADPPTPAAYLVTLAYILLVLVAVQGTSGWTPGKLITGVRLADSARRSVGPVRSFVRWALPDGVLGMVGVLAAIVGSPWPLRLLVVFVPLGLFRALGEFVPLLAGPIGDGHLGMDVIARADYIGGRPEPLPLAPAVTSAVLPADADTDGLADTDEFAHTGEADHHQADHHQADHHQAWSQPTGAGRAGVAHAGGETDTADDPASAGDRPPRWAGIEPVPAPVEELAPVGHDPAGTTEAVRGNPYPPQWDQVRRAYICWSPDSEAWLEWDDQAKVWGPISQ